MGGSHAPTLPRFQPAHCSRLSGNAYKAVSNKDTFHMNHYIIWTLCTHSVFCVLYMQFSSIYCFICNLVLFTALYATRAQQHEVARLFVGGVIVTAFPLMFFPLRLCATPAPVNRPDPCLPARRTVLPYIGVMSVTFTGELCS